MKTIAHLSDLHFGRHDEKVAAALAEELQSRQPNVVAVSGDLTQRARRHEFEAAAHYLKQLPGHVLVVPGNHDVPADPLRRFLAPLDRYTRYISTELNPFHADPQLAIQGLNTARSLTVKGGRISEEQLLLAAQHFRSAPPTAWKVVVTHHPFMPPVGREDEAVGRGAAALVVLRDEGVHLLLAGHLHQGYSGHLREVQTELQRSILVAQAGTCISTRMRGEPNTYNWLELAEASVTITIRAWTGERFKDDSVMVYRRRGREWLEVETRTAL